MNENNRWFGLTPNPTPAMQRVLIVDDNDRYAGALTEHLRDRGCQQIERAHSAAEGISMLGPDCAGFDGIITDISMERELAGLSVIAHVNRCGFQGVLATATTAIDRWYGFALNYIVFGFIYRTDYMIPKRPIRSEGAVLWLKTPGGRRHTQG